MNQSILKRLSLLMIIFVLCAVNLFYANKATTAIPIDVDTKGLTNDSVMGEIYVAGQPSASNMSAPSIAWSKTYPDVAGYDRWILQTSDGGYLLLWANYYSQDSVFSLLKTDSSGNPQWNQSYSVEISGYGQNVIQTSDGGYAVAATYQKQFFLLKIDELGNQQWNKSYTVPGSRSARAIIQTHDGGYALLGTGTQQATPPESSVVAWLVKTDSEGNVEWAQNLGTNSPKSLVQTSDGGYAIAKDFCFNLVKLDSNGTVEWSRTYVDRDENEVSCVVQTSDGGFALAGYMWRRINGGNTYLALVKTDAHGIEQWVQYYGVGFPESMIKTADGGFALAYPNLLIKADANGSKQWEIGIGGYVIQTTDGGYTLQGLVKINDTAYGFGLTKLNRDPALPPASPTPTEPSTSNPENNFSLNLPTKLFVVAVVVVIAVASMAVAFNLRRKRLSLRVGERKP
jgi:hypothetical protein